MKKQTKKLLALVCALTCASSAFVGCDEMGITSQVEIDENKTQLYVGNFDGGMGSRWLDEYKKGFEEMYKDTSFEAGKKGVQVVVLNDKVTYKGSNIISTMDRSAVNVFFTEGFGYYQAIEDGLLLDISDAVTTAIPGESKSVADKLTEEQKSFYQVDGKYYGVPHYRSLRGLIYDKDLFEDEQLYIKNNGQLGGRAGDTDLDHGPDGEYGTYDDGFPATYDQFFWWCSQIQDVAVPIIWTGEHRNDYTAHLMDAMFTDASGLSSIVYRNPKDEAVETKIITGFDEAGAPIEETAQISRNNYKLSTQLAGSYYSLDFLYRIIEGEYLYKHSFNSVHSHEETHYDFLHSRFGGEKPIALMSEGTWWEEESVGIFEDMEKEFEGASRKERRFGFLPLPKPTEEYLGAPTLYDGNGAIAFANATCDDVKAEVAKKFIQYTSMDSSLQIFNMLTNVGRDFQYELTDEQFESLSYFGKDIYQLTEASQGVVYGYPTSIDQWRWNAVNRVDRLQSTVGGKLYTLPADAFKLNGLTARQYFEGVIAQNAK